MGVRSVRGAELRRLATGRALALATSPLAVALLLYAVAAVVATAPGVFHFGSDFIANGGPGFGEPPAGDHLQSVYRFWLVGHQLEQGAAPWRDPYQFQPLAEPQLVLAGWPFGIPFWPLVALFGPVVAWNVLLLAGIVLAGLATRAWLLTLGLGTFPALLGGLAFAIAPYRVIQSGGHLLGWMAIFLPVTLWAYERARAAESRRAAYLWALAAALALVTIPLSGQVHLALGAVPAAVVYAAFRFRKVPFLLLLAGALVGAGIAIAEQRTVIAGSVLAGNGRSLDQVRMFQASWGDLLDRFKLHGLEQEIYSGWLVPLVAIVGAVVLWRRRRWVAVLAALAAVIPLLLAVGTHLPTYEPLWHYFPPMRFPRVPERLLPIADLALAALVAVAVAWALPRLRSTARVVATVLAVLLLAGDLLVLPLEAVAADPGNGAYRALAARPPERTLELPIFEPGIHYGSIYDYYALQTPRERPSGYSTLAPSGPYDFFWRMNRLNCGVWLPGDVGTLRVLGVGSLLFHVGAYEQSARPGAWFAWRALEQQGYRATARGGPIWLFPFTPTPGVPRQPSPVAEPPHDRPVLCEGWKGRRMKQREAPLWIWGQKSLEFRFTAPGKTPAYLQVDGGPVRRFDVDRTGTTRVQLVGRRWHLLFFQVPKLIGAAPPQGLTIASIRPG